MKRSWLCQFGILLVAGIPILLSGNALEMTGGILIWGILSVISIFCREYLLKLGWVKTILQLLGLVLALWSLIDVADWYVEAIEGRALIGILTLGSLLFWKKQGRDAMAMVFGKIILFGFAFVMLFQIPGWESGVYAGHENAAIQTMVILGVKLYAFNLPYFWETLEEERPWHSYLTVWTMLFTAVVLLTGLWRVEALRLTPHPYMLLGQSGSTFSGQGVRLEALNFMLVVVGLYFSAGVCMDGIRDGIKGKQLKAIEVAVVVCLICTGCGPKLSEKNIVIIGDEQMLVNRQESTELSSMQVFIIKSEDARTLIPYFLQESNISFETPVAYGAGPVEETVRTKISHEEYASIRELINSCFLQTRVRIPVVIADRVIGETAYKSGIMVD